MATLGVTRRDILLSAQPATAWSLAVRIAIEPSRVLRECATGALFPPITRTARSASCRPHPVVKIDPTVLLLSPTARTHTRMRSSSIIALLDREHHRTRRRWPGGCAPQEQKLSCDSRRGAGDGARVAKQAIQVAGYHKMAMKTELLVLILSAGMTAAELAATIEKLKQSSKSIGTHKRRQLYWDAYTKMSSKASSSVADGAYVFLKYSAPVTAAEGGGGDGDAVGSSSASSQDDGKVELAELTKRQKGMIQSGSIEILGRALKPPEDPASKGWCVAFSEEGAQIAWDDLMSGEPAIYITPEAVWVGTRHKRALCKNTGAPLKTVKDVEKFVAELKPENPLRSVSFAGNEPPSVNDYNVMLAGTFKLDGPLPPSIGLVNTTSTSEIYDYFLDRKNEALISEANKMLGQMLADTNKGLTPLISASSTKEAAVAYKSALMKKVFVHESMKKFINKAREDGSVELCVIRGDMAKTGEFGQYGGIVFEMFYRVDLSTMT
ncbi:hypothetical protein FVE85_2966 [Porphyridium purpureum]|uniref:Uncharacterized protein n=1 Tax=Porphyridium purpureum TaxID=35688 RepID=A0A5J4YU10_PORPP|nr:hypothetical protein FVE85_2966 [Porphyridium purpureum]|eukprot:POR4782..scf227_4